MAPWEQSAGLSSVTRVERGGAGSVAQSKELARTWQGGRTPMKAAELQAMF